MRARSVAAILSCLAIVDPAPAWTQTPVRDLADLNLAQLADIPIVSAARHEQSRVSSPRAVSVITAEEIRRRNLRNVPEAVASLAGVFLQQTNYAGGSPIIRGMVGNRILLMVNGIRLNNGTYRLGPNQYLNSIDINQVERIEVVRGAGSVLYGSDALGGVVNIITKPAPDSRHGAEISGNLRVRFSSADRSGSGRAELSGTAGPVGFIGGYTREQFGDVWAAGTRGVQSFTGYRDQAGDATLSFALSPKSSLTVGASRLRQQDVARNDLIASGSDLSYLWRPQGRDMLYMRYTREALGPAIAALQITVAYQRPIEYLERITAADPLTRRRNWDTVDSLEAGIQLTSALGKSQVLTYGFTSTNDWIGSTRTDLNLPTAAVSPKSGNYANHSRFASIAFFLQDEIQLSRRLDAVAGVRYDRFRIHADLFDAPAGSFDLHASPSAVNGSGHLLYKLTPHFSLTGGLSQGFRAPDIDDSTILMGSGARYEIPNANLNPERSVNLEYGLRMHGRRGTFSFVTFEDRYRDLIDRGPALLNGLSFLDLNGNRVKDGKEQDIFQRQNISRAAVRGMEFEALIHLGAAWTWAHNTTWTHGTDLATMQPLTRIPPVNGVSRLTWQVRRSFWLEGALLAATAQHRLAPADKTDFRIGPGGTAGFAVFHFRAGLNRGPLAGLVMALENLTNRRYRLHGSGFDRPGINFVIGYARFF